MSILFSPLVLRGTTLRNRLWVSPMCMYSAIDGMPQEWHHTHLAQFASGGAGLIVAEATAVSPEGRISPARHGHLDRRAARRLGADRRGHPRARSTAGIQLAHAGRKASTWWPFSGRRGSVSPEEGGWQTVAPSAVAYEGFAEPAALDEAGIDAVVADFVAGDAPRARRGIRRARGARSPRLPAAPVPLAAVEPPRRRVRRLAREPRAAAAARRARGAGCGRRRACRSSCGSPPRTPPTAASTSTRRRLVAEWSVDAGADLIDVSSGGLVAHQVIEVLTGLPGAARGEDPGDGGRSRDGGRA